MRKVKMAAALLAGLVGGCVPSPYDHKTPLREADYVAYLGEGTATIWGEVSVKMRAGDINNGTESSLYLIPVTAYSTEWLEHYIMGGHAINGPDPRSLRVARVTVVGRNGRFQFRNLPAGDYYLSCTITRELPSLRMGRITFARPSTERIEAYARVTVGAGEHRQVMVTRPPD